MLGFRPGLPNSLFFEPLGLYVRRGGLRPSIPEEAGIEDEDFNIGVNPDGSANDFGVSLGPRLLNVVGSLSLSLVIGVNPPPPTK